MNREISSWQMAGLLFVFLTGAITLVIPAPLLSEARSGVGLSWMITGLFGFLYLCCILYITVQFPGKTLYQCSEMLLGRGVAIIFAIPFIVQALLLAAYIYSPVSGFFSTTMMRETPTYVFNGLNVLVSALTAYAGIEVISRLFTLLLAILVGSIVLVLLFNFPQYHPDYLLPFMPYGFKPILHSAYYGSGVAYGDLLTVAMLFCFIHIDKRKRNIRTKPLFIAFAASWMIIFLVNICVIMALGPMSEEFKYPLYILARLVNFQDFITRIEAFIGIALLIGSIMKATVTIYSLNLVLTQLLKLKEEKLLIIPLALAIFQLSQLLATREPQLNPVFAYWPLTTFVVSLPVYFMIIVIIINKYRKAA
ncbi:endospore germination permease [Paenibacillus sepulcri]|uniref:Spore germination protein n=1 Tax=Paenibacillus sepulcri TaxID=359917 RepID=A0ABS7BZA6_9BACL|nr:spore germination protein [Paenibacillus sepulcri]